MSDLVEYVDRNGDRWAFMAGDHTWLESPAHGGRRCAVWYVLREYGPLVPAGFLADMEGATQDLGEAAEEIERLRAEVASLRQQLDEARTERDHWKGLADEAPEPCPLDHGCEPEEVCSCWCMLHDCALDECPTLKTVEAWLEQLRQEGQRLVRKVRTECDVAEADNARLLDVYRAAEALAAHRFTDADPADATDALLAVVDSYRAGAVWTPAKDGDTPGELVPGEGDAPQPICADGVPVDSDEVWEWRLRSLKQAIMDQAPVWDETFPEGNTGLAVGVPDAAVVALRWFDFQPIVAEAPDGERA